MAQNILSAGDLEGFPNQGKIERGDWVGSSVGENRGLPELSSAAKFIGGKHQAPSLRIVRFTLMALWLSTCYPNGEAVLRLSEGKLRTIFIDYYCYVLKGQNVLWFPLAQMWWVTDISTWLHELHHIRDIHIVVCNTQWFIHLSISLLLRLSKHLLVS